MPLLGRLGNRNKEIWQFKGGKEQAQKFQIQQKELGKGIVWCI